MEGGSSGVAGKCPAQMLKGISQSSSLMHVTCFYEESQVSEVFEVTQFRHRELDRNRKCRLPIHLV